MSPAASGALGAGAVVVGAVAPGKGAVVDVVLDRDDGCSTGVSAAFRPSVVDDAVVTDDGT